MLYVENMRHVDAATWDRLLLESPGGGHVLQTYAWGEFKRASQGWEPLRLALKKGDRVLGVGQLLIRQPPGVPGKIAYCPKGPWIDWTDADATRTMLQGMEHFARKQGAFILKIESELLSGPGLPRHIPANIDEPLGHAINAVRRLRNGQAATDNPVSEEIERRVAEARETILAARNEQGAQEVAGRRVLSELGFVKSRWDMQFRTTMVVDLDRPPDQLLARMKSKWRYNVNLARRKGVTVVEDTSPAARRELFDMYRETAERDNFILRHPSYFEESWRRMIEAGYATIFFACHDGRPLAGMVVQTFGHKMWYHVGASRTEGRNLMPAHALQFHAMQWGYERGMTYYDLVAIPNAETPATDSIWGLYWFKHGFGGRPVEWAGCMDKILDPRGAAWEALEPAYYRLYKWRVRDVLY